MDKQIEAVDVCPACGSDFEAGTFKLCGDSIVEEVQQLRAKYAEAKAYFKIFIQKIDTDDNQSQARPFFWSLRRVWNDKGWWKYPSKEKYLKNNEAPEDDGEDYDRIEREKINAYRSPELKELYAVIRKMIEE